MSRLVQDLGPQSVALTDRAGVVLVDVGQVSNLSMQVVLPLLATNFSTSGELSRQLRDENATSVYIHEGTYVDLYCFEVTQRFLLVLVFNKTMVIAKLGAVWISTKRAVRELRQVLGARSG